MNAPADPADIPMIVKRTTIAIYLNECWRIRRGDFPRAFDIACRSLSNGGYLMRDTPGLVLTYKGEIRNVRHVRHPRAAGCATLFDKLWRKYNRQLSLPLEG